MRQFAYLAALSLACGWLMPATAADTLVMKRHPDSTHKYERTQKTEQTLTIGEGNIETSSSTFSLLNYTSSPVAADGSIQVTQKHEVLQSEINIVGMMFQFDSANPDEKPSSANMEPFAELLRVTYRTPVTMVFDAQGKIRTVSIPPEATANLNPNFADLFQPDTIKKSVAQLETFLPKTPVSVGDEWENTVEAPLGGGQTLTFQMKYQLTSLEEVKGRHLHKIAAKPLSVKYAMDPNSPSPLKITESTLQVESSEGEVLFDAERGMIVSEKSKMQITGPLKFSINGNAVDGKLFLNLSSQLVLQQ